MKYGYREIRDLLFAGIILSFAFAILFSGDWRGFYYSNFYALFGISFLTAGLGFLLHELGHKYAAGYYGLQTEFKAFYPMLGLSVLLSFFGLILAAPGAVFISGTMTKERNGKISLAGPAVNIALGILFFIPLVASELYAFKYSETLRFLFSTGLSINAILALFNLIPVMPLDGAKILQWNGKSYAFTVLIALLLLSASVMF